MPGCVLHNKNPLCPVTASTRPDQRFLPERFSCPETEEPEEAEALISHRRYDLAILDLRVT